MTHDLSTVDIFQQDIPESFCQIASKNGIVACDIETSGLDWRADKIATCQLHVPDMATAIVRLNGDRPMNLIGLLENKMVSKVFHYAMFDLRFLVNRWSFNPLSIKCTKIAAKLLRMDMPSHSLMELLKEYMGIHIDKSEQKSDWFRSNFTQQQIAYAANDVIYLYPLLSILLDQLANKLLRDLAEECFSHIPTQVRLDVAGYQGIYEY
jgi:ribonuclease D